MALNGAERVRRTRMRQAGKEPPLIARGQKSRQIAEIMEREGVSRATAFRRLASYVGGPPVVVPGKKRRTIHKRKSVYIRKPEHDYEPVSDEEWAKMKARAQRGLEYGMAAIMVQRGLSREELLAEFEAAFSPKERQAWDNARREWAALPPSLRRRWRGDWQKWWAWETRAREWRREQRAMDAVAQMNMPPDPKTVKQAYAQGMAAACKGLPLPPWTPAHYADFKVVAWRMGWEEERDRQDRAMAQKLQPQDA